MPTPDEQIAAEMRNELQARINSWSTEREQLLKAAVRVTELDGLIAAAKRELRSYPEPPRVEKAAD